MSGGDHSDGGTARWAFRHPWLYGAVSATAILLAIAAGQFVMHRLAVDLFLFDVAVCAGAALVGGLVIRSLARSRGAGQYPDDRPRRTDPFETRNN